ncbi:MAG: aspartate aminotransferase [Clostridia bacterium]|nr:aspartate aminotransferase [Clostridia bacterium]
MQLADRARGISPSPTLSIDAKAKAMQAQGIKIINFSAGEPDFDTPEHIKKAAVEALAAGFTKYTPVPGINELREAVVATLKKNRSLDYDPSQVVISVGAKHALYNAMQVLLNPGDEVLLCHPYWVSYYEQVKLAGAVPRVLETSEATGFKITPEQLAAAVTPRTRVLLLNSPSNPAGSVYTREELAALAEVILAKNLLVISDEIYSALVYDGREHVSIASLGPEIKERTILIDGVSKTYAMTGWRIGWAVAPRPVAKAMADLQSHSTSNPTSIAQKAAVAALTGTQEPVEEMRREFERRRDRLLAGLQALPDVTCLKPEGAFYLFPNVSGLFGRRYGEKVLANSTDVAEVLLQEAQVAVVPGIAFGADAYLRFSYATSREQIEEGIERIGRFVEQLT